MHDTALILTLTGGLTAALALGFLTQRLGLSPLVGYLLAGVLVGPYTPGFVADRALANQLAEFGVILLMFGVGLHFRIEDLLAVRKVAVAGAICQSALATVLGMLAAHAFGWSWLAGAVYGMAISVASTVVLTRVLADNNELHTRTGRIAIGWLVVEDLFAVLVLVLLPSLASGGLLLAMGLAILKIGALVAVTLVIGDRLIPLVLAGVARTRSRELFTLAILVVALGIAVGSAYLFGVSMALGAFLAGIIVGRSEFSFRAASEALPMKEAFAVLFFVSVGMLFNPSKLLAAPLLILTTLAFVLVGKPVSAYAIVRLLGYPPSVAIGIAFGRAQIGEFSFILASLGQRLQVLPGEVNDVLIAAAILSIALNPLLYRAIPSLLAWQARPQHSAPNTQHPLDSRYQAIVVGYGPVGQTVSRLLREGKIEPVIIELNLETVRRLRAEGWRTVYGDAQHREVLHEAGVPQAVFLVLSASGVPGAGEIIRLAREANPRIQVLARTAYSKDASIIRTAGADHVFSSEGEIALAMTETILRHLGATAEQIDRERDRVRAELDPLPGGGSAGGGGQQGGDGDRDQGNAEARG
jgi:K+:H+ antiporter